MLGKRTIANEPLVMIDIDNIHAKHLPYLQHLIISQKPGTILSDSESYHLEKHKVWVTISQPIAVFEKEDKASKSRLHH